MASGANPFSKIVSSKQAAAERAAEEHKADAQHAATAATPVHSAAQTALDKTNDERLAQQSDSKLHEGDHSTTPHTPENTPAPTPPPGAPAHGPGQSGSSDTGSPQHAFNSDLNAALAGVEAGAHADLARLEALGGVANTDPTGGNSDSHGQQSPEDRLHDAQGAFSPGQSTRDAAKDPEDHGKGGAAFDSITGDLRGQLENRPAPGSDPVTSALGGILAESATHDTNPLNVADDALSDAQKVSPADLAAAAAKAGVTPPSTPAPAPAPSATPTPAPPASGGSSNDNVADHPTFFGTLFTDGPAAALHVLTAPVSASANHEARAADKASGGTGTTGTDTTTVAEAQAKLGINNLETNVGVIGSAFAHSAAGGGAKLTDPNSDDHPPTAAQIAFSQAMNQITHTGPAFHNPGFVDPGPEGDQSGASTGGTPTGVIISGGGEHGLVGDPANPNSGVGDNVAHGGQLNGSISPGHQGGEPGDAQGGIVQDDGNATHGSVHETGPGGEHFGPSTSLGATAPNSSSSSDDDGKSSSDDSSSGVLLLEPELIREPETFHLPDHIGPLPGDDDN